MRRHVGGGRGGGRRLVRRFSSVRHPPVVFTMGSASGAARARARARAGERGEYSYFGAFHN